MRRRRRNTGLIVLVLLGLSAGAAIAPGCSAGGGTRATGAVGGEGGSGGATSSTSSGSSAGGDGGSIFIPDAGGDVAIDVPMNPCGTKCGTTELCDDFHLGLDDDCDGEADEDCACSTGQVHACFLGDPSYHGAPGCFDGVEKCTENGKWGSCIGGVHATQNCSTNDQVGCHPLSSPPFISTDLKSGTGTFSGDAVPGSEVWTVKCPDGVSPCPSVSGSNPADDFKPLQSGEYTVTYTKSLAGGGTDTCTYPLFVGARGLRVELSWEHDLGGTGVDIDLHLHQPNTTQPWAVDGAPQDCGYENCTIDSFAGFAFDSPKWFPGGGPPPLPVDWWKDPVLERNNCYFAPRGMGQKWQFANKGCHNPRLDLDNVTCNPGVSDPDNINFCAPENINVDYPPKNQWFRVGVYYYDNDFKQYDVHPVVKIFCDGSLTAELGSKGYYDPEAPITFKPSDGSHQANGNRFWMVADVAFRTTQGECATEGCLVKPLYADPTTRTPVITGVFEAQSNFAPAYPPPP